MDAPSCHDSACHVCDNLRFQDDHPIKCTVEALEVTTQDCAFCMLFMAAVKNKFGTNLPTISPVPGAWEGDFDLSAVPMDILKDVQVEVSTNMVIDIFQRSQHLYSLQVYSEEKSELCSRIPVLHYVPPTTGSLASFEQAGSWITDCMSNHALCRGSETEKPLLPARVVDVISYELHISEKEERAPYVCLSHCWGPPGHQRYMVTRENIDKNTDDIEWDALPRTFKEAIAWVQRTDIRYIWIDSLCIIQNDLKDWENEAAKMADIYENATITLAATHARSGDDGLFRTGRNLTMRMASPSSDSGSEIIRVCDRIEHITRHPWSIQSMPLLSRGWVFQERYLSRRILHFGPQELFWECLETSKCQCSKLDKATSAGFWLDPMYHVDQKRKYAQTLLDASPKEFIKRYPQGRFDDGWIKRRGGHLER